MDKPMTLKRYRIDTDWGYGFDEVEDLAGDFVYYKDVEAEILALRTRLEAAEDKVDQMGKDIWYKDDALRFWLTNTTGKLELGFEVINVGRIRSQEALTSSEIKKGSK